MLEIIGLTHAKDCDVYSLWKTSLCATFDLHGRVRMKIVSWVDVSVYNLPHNFLCLGSTDMFPRSVLTTMHVHVHVRILRDGYVHTFLTYEVMSMRNFKHITLCLSHNFPQVHSKQSTTSRLLNLWILHTVQLLTYTDVFVCKLSHMKTCLFATCHKISNVLSRPPCFHALCRLRVVFMCVFAH